jgi:hypothetical protein
MTCLELVQAQENQQHKVVKQYLKAANGKM